MKNILDISVIIATANRSNIIQATLHSIASQAYQPREIIIIDGSGNNLTAALLQDKIDGLLSDVQYEKAVILGAAQQRNQGIKKATCHVIGFMDDDILLEPDCIINLWHCLMKGKDAGGVNALITNQHFVPLKGVTELFYQLMNGKKTSCFAGKMFGPVINILPADDSALGDIVPVDWLNTTCTLYKREMLPTPVFDEHFEGYSLMEDLALSLRVAKKACLYNARTARIFHDTQPGFQKNNVKIMAEMDLVNRHYIMRNILHQKGLMPHLKLFLQQLYFGIASRNIVRLPFLKGKYTGFKRIMKKKK
jgi:glycosyltransferase involved in cell wall biosynthesis